ncbi:hypothetical protein [Streptomyces sp. AC154]
MDEPAEGAVGVVQADAVAQVDDQAAARAWQGRSDVLFGAMTVRRPVAGS